MQLSQDDLLYSLVGHRLYPVGVTLIFSYLCRLLFGGSKYLISILLGVFRKMKNFSGMKIMWIFLGVITKLDYI